MADMVQNKNTISSEARPDMIDVAGTGFTVLDRIYVGIENVVSEELGGSCGNVLLSLAMLNRHVAPVLNLGDDEVGERLTGEFRGAGAITRYIRRHGHTRSPVLAQHLDTESGTHFFAFTCPTTHEALPRYEPIGQVDVEDARPILENCAVFYTDRVSEAIVAAMETAASKGAIVYFEPSDIKDPSLFRRAVRSATILKYSADRLGGMVKDAMIPPHTISIITHGESGLEVSSSTHRYWSKAIAAPIVRDTCGAGDMVSVGLIDWLISLGQSGKLGLEADGIAPGIEAGQRLAAENCAFVGARGLFQHRGADYARSILSQSAMHSQKSADR